MKVQILKKDGSKGFKLLVGINRDVIPGQVSKLATSIGKMGIIRPVVVADINFLDEKGTYVLDGQHLLHALMRADLDIPYIKIFVKDKKDMVENIALLNSSSKSWVLKDYVTAWSSISSEYKRLQAYYNIYDFDISLLAEILSGANLRSKGSTITKKIKKGEFKITNELQKKVILDNLTDVLNILPRLDRFSNLYVCREYVSFYNDLGSGYNHEKLLTSLSKRKAAFVLSVHEEGRLVEMFKKLI